MFVLYSNAFYYIGLLKLSTSLYSWTILCYTKLKTKNDKTKSLTSWFKIFSKNKSIWKTTVWYRLYTTHPFFRAPKPDKFYVPCVIRYELYASIYIFTCACTQLCVNRDKRAVIYSVKLQEKYILKVHLVY